MQIVCICSELTYSIGHDRGDVLLSQLEKGDLRMKTPKRTPSVYQIPKSALMKLHPPTDWLTLGEAAQLLRLSPWSVRNFIKKGELPTIRLGRAIRLARRDLDRFMEQHTHRSAEAD